MIRNPNLTPSQQVLFKSWAIFFWITFILLASRFVMLTTYANDEVLAGKDADIWRMWIFGLRYDMRVAGMAIAPLFIFGLALSVSRITWNIFAKAWTYFFPFVAFTAISLSMINHFYYETFHNHIDMFIFGVVNDDTKAVIETAWDDYPVIKMVIIALVD